MRLNIWVALIEYESIWALLYEVENARMEYPSYLVATCCDYDSCIMVDGSER